MGTNTWVSSKVEGIFADFVARPGAVILIGMPWEKVSNH